MITGRYFRFNIDTSLEKEGISNFEYHDFPTYFGMFNDMSPRYPISVAITSSEVKFMIHYFVFTDEGDNYKFKIDKDICAIQHAEETLFSFSYIKDSPDAYAEVLKGLFNVVFPDDKNSYLKRCLDERYGSGESAQNSCRRQIYGQLREEDCKPQNLSYSSCNIWGLIDSNRQFALKKNDRYQMFLRKILLDFMFDLKHTDIFENSIYCEKMKSALMSDFFFSSILKKADYYYCRELMSYRMEAGVGDDAGHMLYMDYYSAAEEEWINTITSPLALKHFKQVHSQSPIKKFFKEIGSRNEFQMEDVWFVDPEEEMRRVLFALRGSEAIGDLTTLSWLESISKNGSDKTYVKKEKERSQSKLLMASRWFLRRYDFRDAYRIHFFSKFNILFVLGLITFISFFVFILCDERMNALVNVSCLGIPICVLAPIAVILSFPLVWLLRWVSNKYLFRIFRKKREGWTYREGKSGLRKKSRRKAFGVFVIFALFLFFILEQVEGGYVWLKWIALGLAFLILLTGYLKDGLHLFLPRLIAAITAAWFTLALSEDLFKAFFDRDLSLVTIVVLVLVVFVFLYSEIAKVIPHATMLKKSVRVFQLMLIGYAMSLFVGFIMLNFTGETFLERSGYLEQYFKEHNADSGILNKPHSQLLDSLVRDPKLDMIVEYELKLLNRGLYRQDVITYKFLILRSFLIQFALMAMFIGVFLQMSFDDKKLTE